MMKLEKYKEETRLKEEREREKWRRREERDREERWQDEMAADRRNQLQLMAFLTAGRRVIKNIKRSLSKLSLLLIAASDDIYILMYHQMYQLRSERFENKVGQKCFLCQLSSSHWHWMEG